jgi:hypothetical protein
MCHLIQPIPWLILYVGVDTLRNLVTGWLQLMEEVKVATTFEQIRDAGERFGKILGREAARAGRR